MARSRNIKPGLWLNEELAEVSIEARYLFPALWCHADKDGRLEFRPKKLKAEIFPYDDLDITKLAGELHGKKFISVYENEGKFYIQIANFAKHQNPHPKEKSEGYPPPVSICNYDGNLIKFLAVKSNLQTPFPSFPSSPLIPLVTEDERLAAIPYDGIMAAFNKFCPSLPQTIQINENRRTLIKAAFIKYQGHEGGALLMLDSLFKRAERSKFLTGKLPGRDGKVFKAKFDWIMDEGKMVKILEGDYDDAPEPPRRVVEVCL